MEMRCLLSFRLTLQNVPSQVAKSQTKVIHKALQVFVYLTKNYLHRFLRLIYSFSICCIEGVAFYLF